jgi:hypothetical protein
MKSNLIARRKKAALASAGADPWVTDREGTDAKAPEAAEVPRLAAKSKAAQPLAPGAPPAAMPAAPAPAPPPAQHGSGAVDLTQISSEGLAKMIKALSGVNDLLNDKALLAVIEKATELLKGRPAEPEAPATAPAAPRAASAKAGGSVGRTLAGNPGCNQCEMLNINGIPCHETGCPNESKTWDEERQDWVRYYECPECGSDVEEGQSCDCGNGGNDMAPNMERFCLGGLNVASFEKEAVTPPDISEKTMHELKDDPSIDEPYAVAWSIHNKKKEGSSFEVVAVRKDAAAEGSWWINVHEQTGDIEESGGRTPEVEEAHGKVDERPAKLDRPETTLPEKLGANESTCIARDCGKQFDKSKPESRDTKTLRSFWQKYCPTCRTKGNAGGSPVEEKKAASDPMKASTALKKVEALADRLKEMYLDAKEICDANDSRPVREAVEAIYRAYGLLGNAAKVLGKQDMQEKAEADAVEAKGKAKKKGGLLDSLVLAGAE